MLSTRLAIAIEPKPVDKEIDEEVSMASASPVRHLRQDLEATAPPDIDDSVLAGFRKGYRERADEAAEKTLAAGASATENILQMAGWIQEMKSRLNRKEFGTFVKGLLQWVGDEARKYLDIARTFEGFDLSHLRCLEPFTIFKLRTKRYAPVVAKLREQPVLSALLVKELIKELLPSQPRKKLSGPQSGWKQCRSGGGRYYNVLLHDEETGLSIEQQALNDCILPQRVIAEAVALRAQHKSSSVQANENAPAEKEERDKVEHAQSVHAENKKLAQELQKREQRIAELEAQLARRKASHQVETEYVLAVASIELNEYEERQVAAIAPEQIIQDEAGTIAAKTAHESVRDNDFLVEQGAALDDRASTEHEQNTALPGSGSFFSSPIAPIQSDSGFGVRHQSKLQPVEILTSAGSWVGGYFVHSCIAVANLVGQERRFTLFDADGHMCNFLGQIRPPGMCWVQRDPTGH